MARSTKLTAQGPARNTRQGTNVMGIQKVINQDYKDLGRDYGKLFVEMYRSKYGKIALGGLALAACVPLVQKLIAIPAVGSFIQENVTEKLPWHHTSAADFGIEAH